MKYRPEVDGLRAVAVVPVIFFHAGVESLTGGFIGVDIFFVISGYLIAYLLLEDKSKGKFSLLDFYERRIRRILPALFFVILVTTALAWFIMLPSQMKEYSQSILAVLAFSSNIFFYFKSGYFSSTIDEKPLVHTWSLAVEEQFYILFPLLMFLSWRFLKHNLKWLLIAGVVSSYILAEFLSRTHPELSFYLMPTRAWELLLGALCAQHIHNSGGKLYSNNVAAFFGFLLILGSIFFLTEHLPHPSFYTIPAVVGSCLVILFANNTFVGSLLSSKLFVAIGLISYSAYLWHQPILAMIRIKSFEEPGQIALISLASLSFLLAAISYRFVERPFREKLNGVYRLSIKTTLLVLGSLAIVIAAFGVLGHIKNGFYERFSMPSDVASTIERSTNAYACFDLPYPHTSEKWGCDIGAGDSADNYDFLVWGDSHLLVSFNSFVTAAQNTDQKGFYAGIRQCTPFLGVHALRYDQEERNCYQLNKRVFEFVKSKKIPKLILVSRWSYYSTGGYDGDTYSYIGLSPDSDRSPEMTRKAYLSGLEHTIAAYSEIGVEVVFMEQVPQQKFHPEELYYLAFSGGDPGENLNRFSVAKEEHLSMQKFVMDVFRYEVGKHDNLSILYTTDVYCDDKCSVGTDKHSFYFDQDHVSVEGAKKLVPAIEAALQK